MPSNPPSVPHIHPTQHHTSTASHAATHINPDFFGRGASTKPAVSSDRSFLPTNTLVAAPKAPKISSFKSPVPPKSEYQSYTMASTTPTPVPTQPAGSPHRGILGWGISAEIAFFVSLAVLGICLPVGLFFYLRRRRFQSKDGTLGQASPGTPSSMDTEPTLSGFTTRPPTASSWLEMLKHRTDTPAPPHTNDGSEELYYEPPKPISYARRKFCSRRSGRMSEADIEKEVREMEEEVRRRSKLSRSRGQSMGVLPDLEDPCSECAMSYTHDERGHTQPIEGRKETPVPFLGSVELDGSPLKAVVMEENKAESEVIGEGIEVVQEKA